jgi:hypothetical protein
MSGVLGALLGSTAAVRIDGLTAAGAATSAAEIKQRFPASQDGLYWISFSDGSKHQILCDMTTSGGGWMNISPVFGPYSSALIPSFGSGGGDLVSNRANIQSSVPFNGPGVANSQAQSLHCQGGNGASLIRVSQPLITEKSITQVKVKARVIQVSNVNCGFFAGTAGILAGSINLVYGNINNLSACSESPNRYDQLFNTQPFEWFHTMTNNIVVSMYTACTGSLLTGEINQIWIR